MPDQTNRCGSSLFGLVCRSYQLLLQLDAVIQLLPPLMESAAPCPTALNLADIALSVRTVWGYHRHDGTEGSALLRQHLESIRVP